MESEAAPFAFVVRFVVHLQRRAMMRSPCASAPNVLRDYSALSSVISKFNTLPAIS